MTLARSHQYGHQNILIYFHFEQLSIISMLFLLLTFPKNTVSEVLPLSIQHFDVSRCNQSECLSEHLRKNKQKMSAGKKTIEAKQTTPLESIQCLR